jgi:hypothetical protein
VASAITVITAENRLISDATFRCHTINFHVALFNY